RYSIAEAQAEGAWQRVGAPYRVETPAGPIPDQIDLAAIPSVTRVAEAVEVSSGPGTMLAVETDDLAAMNAGTRADPRFPLSLSGVPPGVALGTERNPLPAVVAANWTEDEIRPGSLLTVNVPAQPVSVDVVMRVDEVRATFAGLPEDEPFVVVSLPALRAAAPDAQLRPNVTYLSGEGLTAEAIDEAIDDQIGEDDPIAGGVRAFVDSDVTSRVETYDAIRDAPLSQGVTRSFALGVAMATLYAVLAIVTALTLTARARSRDLSYLRTLGLSQPQALRLSVVEHIPSVILASLLGALLGVGIVRLIEPGLNVAAFVGPDTSVPLRTDWLTITLTTLALTLATTGALAVYTAINRRAQLSQTLRVGDG
ncbi:MAG: FtsX-like permease family protein, partial [Vicinamibacterales bacterium]